MCEYGYCTVVVRIVEYLNLDLVDIADSVLCSVYGRVEKLVNSRDLKSLVGNDFPVRVRARPPTPLSPPIERD